MSNYVFRQDLGGCVPVPVPVGGAWGFVEKVGGAILGTAQEVGRAQGAAAALQQQQQPPAAPATPSWLLPVLIGGGALVAIMLLKKKK